MNEKLKEAAWDNITKHHRFGSSLNTLEILQMTVDFVERRIRKECMELAIDAIEKSKSKLDNPSAMAGYGHDLSIKAIREKLEEGV